MITEEKKRIEAFKFNADLSDKDIRSIRASAQGMTTHQYECFLEVQALGLSNPQTNEVIVFKSITFILKKRAFIITCRGIEANGFQSPLSWTSPE